MVGKVVCIINRTTRKLVVTKNAREFVLTPGENWVTEDLVRFAKAQHPVPGTRDRFTLRQESLVGRKGLDDCSELSEELLKSMGEEVLDPSSLPYDIQMSRAAIRPKHPIPVGRRIEMEGATRGMLDPGKLGGMPD